ncbi:sensor histidine kinase [Thermocrinis jamiesonii]|uniref:sensor histidine kinase n=1 Tax=Thermocrinis jamiesonii TaxID=1302351 RepID=UPI0004958A4A|nr:histidine kinase [Thermocrinis jamiesonii]
MLELRLREWVYIMLFALLMGACMGTFVGFLISDSWPTYALSGAIIGFFIFILSLITTELNNRVLIKRIPKLLRIPFSLALAYLSGFFGGYIGYILCRYIALLDIELKQFQLIVSLNVLGILTASVGFLIYLIVISKREWERLKLRLVTQELKNLELQINPHFLFNILNAIAELVSTNPEEAEKALINFSKFLRKTLYSDFLITLREELENLKEYWSIVKLRVRERVSLEIQTQEDVDLEVKVPKFCVQMLVENALKHGLKWQAGIIKVVVRQKDRKLFIEVMDNGVGFNNLKEGVGLKNVKDRLALIGGKLDYYREREFSVFRVEISQSTSSQNRFIKSSP